MVSYGCDTTDRAGT